MLRTYRTDDPVADAERYQEEQERELRKYPVCEVCCEPITTETLFHINGCFYHPSCMEVYFEEPTEDYIEE